MARRLHKSAAKHRRRVAKHHQRLLSPENAKTSYRHVDANRRVEK